jgi:hypothetical protein
MRNTLVIALLLTSSTDAAAGWTKASESQAGTGYIDAASIVRSGDNATMWELTDYKVVPDPDNPYKSVKRQFEFDCKDKRIRLLSSNSVCRQYGFWKYSHHRVPNWAMGIGHTGKRRPNSLDHCMQHPA